MSSKEQEKTPDDSANTICKTLNGLLGKVPFTKEFTDALQACIAYSQDQNTTCSTTTTSKTPPASIIIQAGQDNKSFGGGGGTNGSNVSAVVSIPIGDRTSSTNTTKGTGSAACKAVSSPATGGSFGIPPSMYVPSALQTPSSGLPASAAKASMDGKEQVGR
jgi:hypothetical protein